MGIQEEGRPGNPEQGKEMMIRSLGDRIEQRVVGEERVMPMVPEDERQTLGAALKEAGIKLENITGVGGVLREQIGQVVEAAGMERVKGIVGEVLPEVVTMKGGAVYKKSDREAGIPEPSTEEIVAWAQEVIDRCMEPDFKLDPKRISEGLTWKETTVYRLEAMMSMTYQMLRLCGMTTAEEAAAFQEQKMGKFQQRLIKGAIAVFGKDVAPPYLLEREEKEIIRYAPTGTLGRMLGALTR